MYIYEGYFNDNNIDNDNIIDDIQLSSGETYDKVLFRFSTMLVNLFPKTEKELLMRLKATNHKLLTIFSLLPNINDVVNCKFYTYSVEKDDMIQLHLQNDNYDVIFKEESIYNDSKTLFCDIVVTLYEQFNIKLIDKFCKKLFSLSTRATEYQPYYFQNISVNGKIITSNKYLYEHDNVFRFIPEISNFVSSLIPYDNHPLLQCLDYYNVKSSYIIRHLFDILIAKGNNFKLPTNLQYHSIYLFNAHTVEHGEIDGWMSYKMKPDIAEEPVHKDIFCDYNEDKVKSICQSAADYVLNNSTNVFVQVSNRSPKYSSGLVYTFDTTYIDYTNKEDIEEYIVVLAFDFASPIAQYKISLDDADKVKNILMNDFNLSENEATTWLIQSELIYEK